LVEIYFDEKYFMSQVKNYSEKYVRKSHPGLFFFFGLFLAMWFARKGSTVVG
jgi:hypothetical protein